MNTNKDTHPYAPDDAEIIPPGEKSKKEKKEEPRNELPSLAQLKKNCCDKLSKIFTGELMNERLLRMTGGDASRVAKNLTAFFSLITQDDGGTANNKKYLAQCTLASLVTCFLESMNMQLPFDSRQLVSIVIYDWEAELDISYKGFINALCKHYHNAYVDAKIIMDGDEFTCEEAGGTVKFLHKPKDPFARVDKEMKGVRGAYCYFTYTLDNGEKIERMVRISRDDLWIIRSKAKTKNVWDEFTSEQVLKAIIRRASKIPFAAIDLDIDIEEVANKHFLLESNTGDDRIKKLMAAQQEHVDDNKKEDAPVGDTDKSDAGKTEGEKPTSEDIKETTEKSDEASNNKTAEPIQNGNAKVSDTPAIEKTAPTSDIASEEFITGNAPTETEAEIIPPDPNAWDGKTLYTGDGKQTTKEFASPQAAILYLTRIVSQRKHKSSRKEIIKANALLIGAAIKDGNKTAADDLHKLADQGE